MWYYSTATSSGGDIVQGEQRALRGLLEVNRLFMADHREINAALMNTFFGVAMWTQDNREELSLRELSTRIGLPPTTVSRHLRYLGPGQRKGTPGMELVETYPSPEDGREKLVRLTPKGEALIGQVLMVSW